MDVSFITPFPEIVKTVLNSSILDKAKDRINIKYKIINLFDFLENTNDRIDDYPFGGGKGMILKPAPIFNAFNTIKNPGRVIYPCPDGKLLNHNLAKDLSNERSLIFICGHYKGIDQRVRDNIVTDEISIGDYVVTGGELPALIILDSAVRLIKGVLNKYESAETDSFYDKLLDGPHYTRPQNYNGLLVPDVLVSGNHKKINDWFYNERVKKTKERRKDLLAINANSNGEKK